MPLGSSKFAVNKNKIATGTGGASIPLSVSTVETLVNSTTVQYNVTSNYASVTIPWSIDTTLTAFDFEGNTKTGSVSIDSEGAGSFNIQIFPQYYSPAGSTFKTDLVRASGSIIVEGNTHVVSTIGPLQVTGGTKQYANISGNVYAVVNLTNSTGSASNVDASLQITSLGDYTDYVGAPLEMQVLLVGGGGGTDSANTSLPTFNSSGPTYTYEPWKFMGLGGGAGGATLEFNVPFANLSVTSYTGTAGGGGAIGYANTNYVAGTGNSTTFLGSTVIGGLGVQAGQNKDAAGTNRYNSASGAPSTVVTSPARPGWGGGGAGAQGNLDYDTGFFNRGLGDGFSLNGGANGTWRSYVNTPPYGGDGNGGVGGGETLSEPFTKLENWFTNATTINTNQPFYLGVGGSGSPMPGDAAGLANVTPSYYGDNTWNTSENPETPVVGNGTLAFGAGGSPTTTQGAAIGSLLNVTVTPSNGNNGCVQVRFPYFTPTRSITS